MPTWDNALRHHPGLTVTAAELEKLQNNIAYLAGALAAQTEIVGEVPIQFKQYLESTHTTRLEQVKDAGASIPEGSLRNVFEYESRAATTKPLPTESRLRAAIENTTGANRQPLGDIAFMRESEGNGLIQLLTYILTEPAASITVDSQGRVGILGLPEYTLDVPSGTLNVSGDFRRDGVVIADWTVTPGAPDVASWAGPAVVTEDAISTLATGTAPLAATSTTECVRLAAAMLVGETWHPGIMASGMDTYTSSDTDIVVEAVNRIGTWKIDAVFAVHLDSADAGKTINCKVKDGGGTQLGFTSDFEAEIAASGDSVTPVKVTATYVSAAGNENIKATVAVVTGSGSIAEATLVMEWQGP